MKLTAFLKTRPEISLLLGGAGLVPLSIWLATSLPVDKRWQAYLFILVGNVFLLVGVARLDSESTSDQPGKLVQRLIGFFDVYPNQIVLIVFSLLLAVIAALAAGEGWRMWNLTLAVLAWVTAIFLVIAGTWRKEETFPSVSRPTLLWAGFFFLAGFLIRGFDIEHIPYVLTGDEASMGLSSLHYIEGEFDNIFSVGWFSFPALFYWVQSIFIRVFDPTITALRLPSVLISSLTISSLYLIARRMFNPITALLSAVFLTGFHFNLHFSRLGLNNIWDAFWFTLVLGMFWDGWQHNRRSNFIIAGVGLGLAQYFYISSRLLPFLIIGWVVIQFILNRPALKGQGGHLASFFIVGLVVMLPITLYFAKHPDQFAAPFTRVDALGDWLELEKTNTADPAWKIVGKLALTNLRIFFDTNLDVWYKPQAPLLRPFSSGIFLVGLVLLLRKWRDNRTHMLILWMLAVILPATLSIPPAAAQRWVAISAVTALVVGFGLGEIVILLSNVWPKQKRPLSVIAVALMVLISLDDIRFYYQEYTPISQLGGQNTLVAQRLADYLQDQEPLDVVFFGFPRMGYYSISSLPYLAPHITGLDYLHPWGSSENPEITNDHINFVFLPEYRETLEAVSLDYPQGYLKEFKDKYGTTLFWLYDVNQ